MRDVASGCFLGSPLTYLPQCRFIAAMLAKQGHEKVVIDKQPSVAAQLLMLSRLSTPGVGVTHWVLDHFLRLP